MTNPTHRLKKFVRYVGDEKPASCYLTNASGWLGSGVKDINGVEIYEGDIILLDGKKFVATIDEGSFIIKDETGEFYYLEPLLGEIIGHIAEGKQ